MRVLVVEDDLDIQDLVIALLGRDGHDVVAEGDGWTGLATALSRTPDLVILDWMMPGMSGIDVCRALRDDARTKDVPVLMLTSKAQEGDIDQAFTAGANDYMVKPFRGRELVSRVRALTTDVGH